MRRWILPLSIILVGIIPLVVGRLVADWLVRWLAGESLWGWVVGLGTAVTCTLLFIAGWALYRDEVWEGLMHPLAFMGSVTLVMIALLSLPSMWKQLRLLAEGETAVGTVESLSTALDYDNETSVIVTIYYVTYRFVTDSGESLSERIEVSQSLFQRFSEGEAITIAYLPEKPAYSLPEIAIEPENRARRIFTFLLAVFVVLGETAVITKLLGKNRLYTF